MGILTKGLGLIGILDLLLHVSVEILTHEKNSLIPSTNLTLPRCKRIRPHRPHARLYQEFLTITLEWLTWLLENVHITRCIFGVRVLGNICMTTPGHSLRLTNCTQRNSICLNVTHVIIVTLLLFFMYISRCFFLYDAYISISVKHLDLLPHKCIMKKVLVSRVAHVCVTNLFFPNRAPGEDRKVTQGQDI